MQPPAWTRRALLAATVAGCSTPRALRQPPDAPREFRAAWVATVANIDWPSRPALPGEAQRAEMLAVLDGASALGLNAIVLQVRPAADALYASALEPWSEYLSGASGRAPDPPWDPLEQWVSEAHRRGLALHAWLNPYRAWHPSARSTPAATHVRNAEADLVRAYGDQHWLDPGEPRAAERLIVVVQDLLDRYDLDGIHIDDYFYPYPAPDGQGGELAFPDEPSWQRYLAAGGRLARDDWRRDNVDRLVRSLHLTIRASKPWVLFGISPFGLPRPDLRPPGITGFSQYHKLYAHVERWLAEGWLDYLAPQLYWPLGQPGQDFAPLLDAWHGANTQRRHLWPGLFTSRVGAARNAYPVREVLAQVAHLRAWPAASSGHLHFSWTALAQDREGLAQQLRAGPYAQPALVPATPWLAEPPPAPPAVDPRHSAPGRVWPQQREGPPLRQALLWQRRGDRWWWQALPLPAEAAFELDPGATAAALVGIGRTGQASAPRWLA